MNNESDEEKEEDSVHTCSLLDSDQDMEIIQIDFNENDDDILHLDWLWTNFTVAIIVLF